jgi:hydroxymethylglutaryl-CoA lyase
MKDQIQIVEVGPRDGLQNEKSIISVENRVEMIRQLCNSGLKRVEIGAFVSEKWVPQMANSGEVVKRVLQLKKAGKIPQDVQLSCLTPNVIGLRQAIEHGVKEVAIFGACTESFSKKNINCTIAESFIRFADVLNEAKSHKIKVRGYLSMAFGCPYEGNVPVNRVVKLAKAMLKLGVYEVSIGDTIGVATPKQVETVVRALKKAVPVAKLAMHFHDTRGTALANVYASLKLGIKVFDSSVGGLGGCPYAPGAAGNLQTEKLVYMLHGMDYRIGAKLEPLQETAKFMNQVKSGQA